MVSLMDAPFMCILTFVYLGISVSYVFIRDRTFIRQEVYLHPKSLFLTIGKKVNLKKDQLQTSSDNATGIHSFLCSPIHDPEGLVVGVISLANKEASGQVSVSSSDIEAVNHFTNNDERFVEAFAIFCGMAIRNAADYEKAVVSEAKLQVAFEVMNYQATSSSDEMTGLISNPVPAASSINIDSFEFSYLNMDDNATLTVKFNFLYRNM